MNEQKHINYSAADIERYHKGSMSPTEMHALEKAALDDPFLADALEGYLATPVIQSEDILSLEKKLDLRIAKKEEGKVVLIQFSKLPWLKIAALFILIAGAGLITYQSLLRRNSNEVAKTEKNDTPQSNPALADSTQTVTGLSADKPDSSSHQKVNELVPGIAKKKSQSVDEVKAGEAARKDNRTNDLSKENTQTETLVSVLPKAEEKKNSAPGETLKKSTAVAPAAPNTKLKTDKDAGLLKSEADQKEARDKTLNEAVASRNFSVSNTTTNVFRGRVLDASNTPLPFANVINIQDNVGTYTDAKGNFVLVSPDSALNVQVHSVGFENNVSQLKNNVASNTVVMQPDTKNIAATVISTRKINTERKRQDNMTLEEPEPSDGWFYYDTYLANNISIPDEIKANKSLNGEVELSFSINKRGEPVNIKVERSVCKECDAEAIRLVKEGPKWKKKNKNTRAKIAVAFEN